MNTGEIFAAFSARFVAKERQERFVFEAMKKPRKLHARVCHELPTILANNYENGSANFAPSDVCLFLGWSGELVETTWAGALERMSRGGGGHLVISSHGDKFYAESEGNPPATYAAHS